MKKQTKFNKILIFLICVALVSSLFLTFIKQPVGAGYGLLISDIRVSVEDSEAYISWRTNYEATGLVKFDQDEALRYSMAVGTQASRDHAAVLMNLRPQTKYYFQIVCADARGGQTSSFVQTFTTDKYTYRDADFEIEDRRVLEVAPEHLVFYWRASRQGSGWVEYKEAGTDAVKKQNSKYRRSFEHQVYVKRLKPDTIYVYRMMHEDKDDNVATSGWFDIKTSRVAFSQNSLLIYDVRPVDQNDPNIFANEVVITWRSNYLTGGTVVYKKVGSFRKYKVSEPLPFNFNDHRIKIQGLEPDTKYIFYIESKKVDSIYKTYKTHEYELVTKPAVVKASFYKIDVGGNGNGNYSKPNVLYKVDKTGEIYAVFEAGVYKVLSPEVLLQNNYVDVPTKVVSKMEVDKIKKVRLVKTPSSPAVYYLYLSRGSRKPILSASVFESYLNNKWSDIITISEADLGNYKTAYLIKTNSSKAVYKIEGNTKRPILSATAFVANGFGWEDVVVVNQVDVDSYISGDLIK